MIFVLMCRDRSGALQVRLDTRPRHVAYIEKLNAEGILRFAGPFLDDEGKPYGSLVAIEVADRAAAEKVAAADPYSEAGLFESVEIHPWNWVFNKPEGW